MFYILLLLPLLPLTSQAAECGEVEWFVKPNGAALTRPAYTLVAGGLIKSKERAPVGATCDLTRPSKQSGKDVYASYDSPDLVALCSKR